MIRVPPGCELDPSKLLHSQSSIPDLRHVTDFLTIKIHHIHMVCLHTLASGCARATLTSMSAGEDAVSTDAVSLTISAKGPEFISSVRNERQQTLDPVRVYLPEKSGFMLLQTAGHLQRHDAQPVGDPQIDQG